MSASWLALLCSSWTRRPAAWLVCAAAISVPAVLGVRAVRLDTDLIRLLPDHARASEATRQLEAAVGGSSYFAVILESDDPEATLEAAQRIAERAAGLRGVASAEYRHPVEFIERYRYMLIPSRDLDRIEEEVLRWEERVNPFVDNLDAPRPESFADREERKEMEESLLRFGDIPAYHQSEDGRVFGVFVRPAQGVNSLAATRRLFADLDRVAREIAVPRDVWVGISGSMRNKIDEYEVVTGDLSRSSWIASVAIVVTLLVAFRSLPATIIAVVPLLVGMLWGFALVPAIVGDLNTITAFLLLIVFGMGIDFSIHLIQRFRMERAARSTAQSLLAAYTTTGRSVVASGLTTALALGVLAISDFRGFSEFGIVGAIALLAVLAAMYVVLPPLLVLASDRGWLSGRQPVRSASLGVPRRTAGVALIVLGAMAAVLAAARLRFDYDFSNLRAADTVPASVAIKEKQRLVYRTTRSPAAIYVAPDLDGLDASLAVLEAARDAPGSLVGRVASLRDLAPGVDEMRRRAQRLADIRELLSGGWTRRVTDERQRRWITDLQSWKPVDSVPTPEQIPAELDDGLRTADGLERPLLAVYPALERGDGRNAMAFTEQLYSARLPDGTLGPVGETPVFAEILWLVLGEGPWLVGLTLLGVVLIVAGYQRSIIQTGWIVLPLMVGAALTLGTMALLGWKLNFFNVVVLPALLGLGVDDGVHYYRRWRELRGDTAAAHAEMFWPLTVTSLTTMMGYSGMAFARHEGLQSIGATACLGLALIWLASLFMLPPLLEWLHRRPAPGDNE